MARLKRWTIFYPDGKKDLTVDGEKLKRSIEKEHWRALMNDVVPTLGIISFEQFVIDGLGIGEQAYTNYCVNECLRRNIPLLQYIEEKNTWIMYSPENYTELTKEQYDNLFCYLPRMKRYGQKYNFINGCWDGNGNLLYENDYGEFSRKLYHDYYGKAMTIDKTEQNKTR